MGRRKSPWFRAPKETDLERLEKRVSAIEKALKLFAENPELVKGWKTDTWGNLHLHPMVEEAIEKLGPEEG
jgi:hypothetical protein